MTAIPWGRILGVLALIVAALGIATYGVQRLHSDLESAGAAKVEAEQARTDAREANRRASAVSGVAHDAQLQNDASRVAADRAADALAAERVRIAAYVQSHRGDIHPAAAGTSEASDPIGVFAALQERFDEAAGRYAAEADANRIAGLACERAYDSLSVKP